jgi:8-oxo-dGTP diphosphatase
MPDPGGQFPTILATLCYIQQNGCTLMLHRTKRPNDIHSGKWNGLGGKFLPGESPEECVIREVREESGLEIKCPRLRGLLLFPAFKGSDWYVFVFTAHELDGDIRESEEGYLKWIPDPELESLPLWPSDHIFLPWIRQGRFFSARFTYAEDQMLDYAVTFHG